MATALLVVLVNELPVKKAVLIIFGLATLLFLLVILRRWPQFAAVLVIGGFALQPALKFFVSQYFGPAKDVVVIVIVVAFVSRLQAHTHALRGSDATLAVFVVSLLVLYILDPAGGHGLAWSDETRLVLETFLLLLVALGEPEVAKTVRVAIATLIVVGCGEAVYGLFQQAVGYAWLIHHLGYAYGGQVRLTSGGNLRSFGTFDDAFSYGSFELLALVASMRWRSRHDQVYQWMIPAILAGGVIVSFVRTDWGILAVLILVAICRSVRRSAWVGFLAASGAVTLAVVIALASTHLPVGGSASSDSYLLTLDGRTLVWYKIVPTPLALISGDGVGSFGSGLARATLGSGIVQEIHYTVGKVAPVANVGAVTSLDSSYFATLADVGIPGLLLLLSILYRLLRIFRHAIRQRSTAGWTGLGFLFVMAADSLTRTSLTAFPSGYIYLYLIGVMAASALADWDVQANSTSGGSRTAPWPFPISSEPAPLLNR